MKLSVDTEYFQVEKTHDAFIPPEGEVYERDTEEMGSIHHQSFLEAIEAAGHSIYVTDENGVIEYANPEFEKITGYSKHEAVGQTPRILKSGEHNQQFYQELWETIISGEVWRGEITNTTKSGNQFVVDQSIAPVTDDTGAITNFVSVNIDITDQKERERELKRERDRLDEFANIVSHDLRNPLTVIKGRVKLAREETDSEHLDAIETAAARMERLINDVLWLSREGRDIGSLDAVQLSDVVDSAWTLVADGADKPELRYKDGPQSLPTFEADSDRLRQLLENLFRNTIEHGGDDVTVTVGVLDDGFYIEDNGPGIPESRRDDVFTPGYSTSEAGTGFGLSIVKQVVEGHGWVVRVTDGSNGGARFEITGIHPINEEMRMSKDS
ncbi:PAS domain S-box protein [Halomicroarcula sp. F13]|uniref:histidine kinase n=1 Tax=Haloarcula rubra TaxID=2487747 RepID=A0AAW4PVH3_9EURY|nr:HAMP domain-containing sensor histidine kinase [Halomicroarcula rubra]MBX0325172.1 PAS domain S-box protein [Halomicroarcula rubra]